MTQLDHVILFDSTAMSAARTALWDSHQHSDTRTQTWLHSGRLNLKTQTPYIVGFQNFAGTDGLEIESLHVAASLQSYSEFCN